MVEAHHLKADDDEPLVIASEIMHREWFQWLWRRHACMNRRIGNRLATKAHRQPRNLPITSKRG